MSLAATSSRPRVVTRSPSNTSLNVGLPPPIPSSMYQTYTPPTNGKHHRPSQPHRGDVSSTATSDDGESEGDELSREPGWVLPPTPARVHLPGSMNGTGAGMESSRKTGTTGKRMTLQERLAAAAAAKINKSDSSTSVALPKSSSSSTIIAKVKKSASSMSDLALHSSGKSGDKVVVCVRIKPTSSTFSAKAYEISRQSNTLILADAHPNIVKRGGKSGREAEYTYTFDALLEYPARTPDLYEDKIAPLVDKTMNGFNSTIFAYGQTGSGKSFTMTGTRQELGIIPCAVDGVFDAINNEPDRAFLLRVSYVEIYNETIRDLLNFKKGPLTDAEKPVIHTQKGKVYVEPLKEEIVSTPQEIVDLLEHGNLQRRTGATDWNERSSRSHSVFTITVESSPRGDAGDTDTRRSCLNLIDLAGSEKAVSDLERRGEGKHINQSLLALREVINKLTEKHKKNNHIPYRNSKLTHLLENALDGQSNIAVICTLSVEEAHCAETLETLKFAGRCSQVETKALRNILPASEKAVIRAKEDEINELKRQLQHLAAEGPSGTGRSAAQSIVEAQQLQADLAVMEDRKSKLATQLAKLNGEILTSQTFCGKNNGRPIRRRISDSARGLGVGFPQSSVAARRAVSGMSRVSEDSEAPIELQSSHDLAHHGRSFDLEREIASLRRTLVAREAEMTQKDQRLHVANKQLEELSKNQQRLLEVERELQELRNIQHRDQEVVRVATASAQSRLHDVEAELERTRNKLVLTTEEKDKKLADLESTVLDLRRSREELLLEDQARYDDLQQQLARAHRDLVQAQQDSTSGLQLLERQLSDAEKEKNTLCATMDKLKIQHSVELERAHQDLGSQLLKVSAKADKAAVFATKCKELAAQLSAAESLARKLETERTSLQTGMAELQAAREASVTAAAASQMENERIRRDAAVDEAALVAQLRMELASMQEAGQKQNEMSRAALAAAKQEHAEELAKRLELQSRSKTQSEQLERYESELAGLRQAQTTSATLLAAHDASDAAKAAELVQLKAALQGALQKIESQDATVALLKDTNKSLVIRIAEETSKANAQTADAEQVARSNIDHRAQNDRLEQELAALNQILSSQEAIATQRGEQLRQEHLRASEAVTNSKTWETRALTAESAVSALETRIAASEAHQASSQQSLIKTLSANENALMESKAEITQHQAPLATADAATILAKSRIDELENDLLSERKARKAMEDSLKPTPAAPHSRHASTPAGQGSGSMPSLEPLQQLIASSTGSNPHSATSKLQNRERQEIQKLEKIVEGQKAVIEELKANLLAWQKQLADQEQVVKLLTGDLSPNFSPRPNKTSPLSPSRRQDSEENSSALGSSKLLFKTGSYGQLTVSGSPIPLPPHPTQKSNASARKGRRITIEHDINRLASSRSVDRARAVFSKVDQPSTPTRAGGQPSTLSVSMTPTHRKP